jgi:DNA topoisomerase-1
VGRDARGRKQYRYHKEWRRRRDADKYERVLKLAGRLPRIREAVERDLALPGMPRQKVLALVVRLLEVTHLRIGGEAYQRLYGSYGLTTLLDRQVSVDGASVRFRFRGKSGIRQDVGIEDLRLARLVRRLQDLPGRRLFEYLDEDDQVQVIRSEDVNAYLRDISGLDVTAKDFRTWAGTVLAFRALRGQPPPAGVTEGRRQLRWAIEQTAQRLGNTAAVTRSSYVDTRIVEAWTDGDLGRVRVGEPSDPAGPPSPEEEAALLRIMRRRSARRGKRRPTG